MDNILKFRGKEPAATVDAAIDLASKANYKQIIILGYDKDDDLYVICSQMNNKDALWILRNAEIGIV